MAGLAQKGGAVQSHVRLAATPSELHATRVPRAQADLILGCDLMTSAGTDPMATLSIDRTRALMNTDVAPTGAFTRNPDWQASPEGLLEHVRGAVMELAAVDATRLATALLGDAVASNMFMLGYAWQKGWIPLQRESLSQAIELNGAAVAMNQGAFTWGRQAALDLTAVRLAAGIRPSESLMLMPNRLPSLAQLLIDRDKRLSAYQDAAYAQRYRRLVTEIARLEQSRTGGDRFAREVAVSLYKLMAYKDEYEVARLHVETGFFERIREQFDGKLSLRFHLAPPLLARKDEQGHLVKKAYGPWVAVVFKALAKLKGLRGTPFDPFGYTAERRSERQAIRDFEALMSGIAAELDHQRMAIAMELARLPQAVKGFGHVRDRNARAVTLKQAELMRRWKSCNTVLKAA